MKTIQIRTSQNVKIDFELATVFQRLLATFLDVVIIVAYLIISNLILGMFSIGIGSTDSMDALMAIFYLIIYLPVMLYSPLMEYLTKGQTLGKLALGIRVTKVNGDNASFREFFTRWLFRPVEFYMIMFLSGLGSIFWGGSSTILLALGLVFINAFIDILLVSISTTSQRLGDVMSNTVIVRKNPSYKYSLRDVLSIKSQSKHTVTYPSVIQFTDEDMMLIKNTITRVERYRNEETKKFAINLAEKTADMLALESTPKKRLAFLKTVLDDYIVLTR